jgi:hypothetical protein
VSLHSAENFKFSRLVLQGWLQSAPELVLIGVISYRNIGSGGPAVVISGPILLQVRPTWLLLCVWLCRVCTELVLIGVIFCSDIGNGGPAVVIRGPILLQVRPVLGSFGFLFFLCAERCAASCCCCRQDWPHAVLAVLCWSRRGVN